MKKRNNAFARLVGLLLVSATVLTLTVAATPAVRARAATRS